MKQRKQKDIKHLLELLGAGDEPAPSLLEARMIQEDNGTAVSHIPKRTECGKVGYSSESACNQAGKHRLKKGSNVNAFRSYLCNICPGSVWHLTSAVKTIRNSKKNS